jgi:putative transposase
VQRLVALITGNRANMRPSSRAVDLHALACDGRRHVLPKGFHRIRHYGLFASAKRAETIARARELLGLATPAPEEAVETDPAAAQILAQPCPCYGGRMFVIETFEAGCQPRCRPSAMRIDTS